MTKVCIKYPSKSSPEMSKTDPHLEPSSSCLWAAPLVRAWLKSPTSKKLDTSTRLVLAARYSFIFFQSWVSHEAHELIDRHIRRTSLTPSRLVLSDFNLTMSTCCSVCAEHSFNSRSYAHRSSFTGHRFDYNTPIEETVSI